MLRFNISSFVFSTFFYTERISPSRKFFLMCSKNIRRKILCSFPRLFLFFPIERNLRIFFLGFRKKKNVWRRKTKQIFLFIFFCNSFSFLFLDIFEKIKTSKKINKIFSNCALFKKKTFFFMLSFYYISRRSQKNFKSYKLKRKKIEREIFKKEKNFDKKKSWKCDSIK